MTKLRSEGFRDIISSWKNCTKCEYHKNKKPDAEAIVGNGALDQRCFVIVPKPIITDIGGGCTIAHNSKEGQALAKILEKMRIDYMDLFITPAVACPTEKVEINSILACNKRIKELILVLRPSLVLLMGPESYFSFYGSKIPETYGWQEDVGKAKVYYSPDLTRAISDNTNELAKALFEAWKEVAEVIKKK